MSERFWIFRVPQDDEILRKVQEQKVVAIHCGTDESVAGITDRNRMKEIYRSYNPEALEGRVNTTVGQLYCVAQIIKQGHWILTPKKSQRTVLFGRATSGYEYLPNLISTKHCHAIRVEWLGEFSRDQASSSLRNSMGGSTALYNIDKHRNELLRLMGQGGGDTPDLALEEVPEGVPFFEDVKSKSEELITDLIARVDPYAFQELVAGLLEAMGYRTRVSDRGADQGVDIIAHPDPLGFETPRIKVQVKHRQSAAGGPDIRNLVGTLGEGEKGLFVSTGGFTTEAKNEARRTSRITVLDADEFVKLLIEHYETLDSDYKSIIPLRKLWVPTS
jgi:restriction system protein